MPLIAWAIRLTLFVGYVSCQVYICRKAIRFVVNLFSPQKASRIVVGLKVVFVLVNLPLISLIPLLRNIPGPAFFLRPFGDWAMGSMFSCIVLLIIDALLLVKRLFSGKSTPSSQRDPSLSEINTRRKFLKLTSSIIATAPVAAFAYGAAQANGKRITIERSEIPVQDLPEALSGLSICQVSDVHFESFIDPTDLEKVVATVNELQPDLIFLTGDFLTYQVKYLDPFVELFSKLKAQHGIYGCLGNHEVYVRTEDKFTKRFKKHWIEILRHETRDLTIRNEKLKLIGIDYLRPPMEAKVAKLLKESTKYHPTILISHHPNAFPAAAEAGVDVTFSGHTHGGQIMLKLGPLQLAPSQIVSPYISGRYTQGRSSLYVNRGLGTVGPPVRVNAPPEITLATLVRK